MVTCGYAQGTTLRHAHPRAIVLNSVDSLTFNASHFSHTPSHSNSAPRPWISQPTNRTPDSAHRARHTAHHARARGLPEPQRNIRTLPNNVARNSPRSFFDYASKRCNSNDANSKFEIVTRELRATLIEGPAVEGHEDYSSDRPDQHHAPHTALRTPRATHRTPRTTRQRGDCPSRTLPNNVARNSPRSFFDYASKRCNSNTANSKFEIVSRELRATLIEQARRRPTAPHGAPRRPAASRPSGTKTGSRSQKAP